MMENNKQKSGPTNVKEMSIKTFKWLFWLFVIGCIVEGIYASSQGREAWIITMLETYFPNMMNVLFRYVQQKRG